MSGASLVMGDFNAILQAQDTLGANDIQDHKIKNFTECITCQILEMRSFGNYYSWSNKGRHGRRIWSRIDKALTNLELFQLFEFNQVKYMAEGISDHTPLILSFPQCSRPLASFQYCDL